MRTPNLADRLSMASAAKKAQLERAKRMAEDPEQAQRLKARDEIIAARNARVAERRAATERDAAELAAKQAAEAAAGEADRKTEAEARARRLAERPRGRPLKPPSERRSSPHAEPAGRTRSAAGIKGAAISGTAPENSGMCEEVHTWLSPGRRIPSTQMSVFGEGDGR